MSAIYHISASTLGDAIQVTDIWKGTDVAPGLSTFVQFPWDGGVLLLGQAADGAMHSYRLTDEAPFLQPVASALDLAGPCDMMQPFVIGGLQHLIAYRATTGMLSFHRFNHDLTLSPPFKYYRLRPPALTTGWSMMQPLTYLGMVYYVTYDIKTGAVEMFNINVTAAPTDDAPPLQTMNVWSWVWAHGWTHFAFFQFGGENFFFKINVAYPNVNIDHLSLDPNQRSNEVCTQKGDEMPNNQDPGLKVRAMTMAQGTPYLVTYMPSGETTFYRIHGDCQGWTNEGHHTFDPDAHDIVPFRMGDRSFLFVY